MCERERKKGGHEKSCKYSLDSELREDKFTKNDIPEKSREYDDVSVIAQWA